MHDGTRQHEEMPHEVRHLRLHHKWDNTERIGYTAAEYPHSKRERKTHKTRKENESTPTKHEVEGNMYEFKSCRAENGNENYSRNDNRPLNGGKGYAESSADEAKKRRCKGGADKEIYTRIIETVEKAAEICVKVRSMSPVKAQTITVENFRTFAKAFGFELPERFLF